MYKKSDTGLQRLAHGRVESRTGESGAVVFRSQLKNQFGSRINVGRCSVGPAGRWQSVTGSDSDGRRIGQSLPITRPGQRRNGMPSVGHTAELMSGAGPQGSGATVAENGRLFTRICKNDGLKKRNRY